MNTAGPATKADRYNDPAWVAMERRKIKLGQRPPAALGEPPTDTENDGSYILTYPHLPDHPGVEMDVPQPFEGYDDSPWTLMSLPLIDPNEAALAATRFGKAKRHVIKVVFDSHSGATVLHGRSLGRAIEVYLADRDNREPDLSDNRARTLSNAVKSLCDWGQIHLFGHIERLNDGSPGEVWLLQSTEQLAEAMPHLLRRFPKEFGRVDHPEEDEGFAPFVNLDSLVLQAASEQHWLNRTAPRTEAVVRPKGKGYPDQHVQMVVRAVVAMDGGLQPVSGAAHMVSEIIPVSSMSAYKPTTQKMILDAMREMALKPVGKSAADVHNCLRMLTVDDQMAIYDWLFDQYAIDSVKPVLRKAQFEGLSGVDLVKRAIDTVPSQQMRRTHVVRQVRLLAAAIIQDLVGLWAGQIVDSSTIGESQG